MELAKRYPLAMKTRKASLVSFWCLRGELTGSRGKKSRYAALRLRFAPGPWTASGPSGSPAPGSTELPGLGVVHTPLQIGRMNGASQGEQVLVDARGTE